MLANPQRLHCKECRRGEGEHIHASFCTDMSTIQFMSERRDTAEPALRGC